MSGAVPPRNVPTLTEVVHESAFHEPVTQQLVEQATSPLEEQMVCRLMQRVDVVLERRLLEAVSEVILAHTQALGPRLREEIELVVRESVSQAVAQELNHNTQ
jgi:flagellar biosynthesis component FlhA